jgi:hypothetical protein
LNVAKRIVFADRCIHGRSSSREHSRPDSDANDSTPKPMDGEEDGSFAQGSLVSGTRPAVKMTVANTISFNVKNIVIVSFLRSIR